MCPPEPLTEVLAAVLFPLNFLIYAPQGPSKLHDLLINLFQALSLLVIHVTRRKKLDRWILVTVGLMSIHSIILPHFQAEHCWAASTCSSVNLPRSGGLRQDFSASCLPSVPFLCIVNPITLPFLSLVFHCSSFFLLFVTFSPVPQYRGFKVLLKHFQAGETVYRVHTSLAASFRSFCLCKSGFHGCLPSLFTVPFWTIVHELVRFLFESAVGSASTTSFGHKSGNH